MTTSGQGAIPVGYVRKAHGIRGDVVVRGLLEDAHDRLVVGSTFPTNEEQSRMLSISAVAPSGSDLRVHFDRIDDRNAAEALKGTQLMMSPTDRRTLGNQEWWPEDLVGCRVVTGAGDTIGEVVEVILAGVQDRLVVARPDGARAEIPFVEALVPQVDLARLVITVDLPDGLFD